MGKKAFVTLATVAVLMGIATQAFALSDGELKQIRKGFDARANELFGQHVASELVKFPAGDDADKQRANLHAYVFSRLQWAVSAMSQNERAGEANAAVLDAIGTIRRLFDPVDKYELHWTGPWFYRLYALFGPEGKKSPNNLSPEAAEAIVKLFADWARTNSPIAEAAPGYVWIIWGSENHSAMRDGTCWAAAQLLSKHPLGRDYVYADGSTPVQQAAAWSSFLKRYFRERIAKGMLIEIGATGYGSRTLSSWYNYIDFARNRELRELARAAMDVWWADWAILSIHGQRGGGKCRIYQSPDANPEYSGADRNLMMSWFYLGKWRNGTALHEGILPTATSTYRMPLVIMDIALDEEGRGVYEASSRRPGRMLDNELSAKLRQGNTPIYVADPDWGAINHYTYCAPEFNIGSMMIPAWPKPEWTAISSQNRWMGAMFRGDDHERYIMPQVLSERASYNAMWSVQRKGTLICQKLATNYVEGGSEMRVAFSKGLNPRSEGNLTFAEAPGAFGAVRVIQGGYRWVNQVWISCTNDRSPVIIEVARKADYGGDFAKFKAAVRACAMKLDADGTLDYTGLYGDAFTLYGDNRLPEINKEPIDLAPPFTFQSPFMNEAWATGLVTIRKDSRELVIDARPFRPVRNGKGM